MEGMKEFPDKFFDLAIVDPPYGINYDTIQNSCAGTKRKQNGGIWKKYKTTTWDHKIPDDEYFNDLFRVSTNQIIWGANYYNNKPTKCWIVWDKKQRDNRSDGEMAWTSFNKPMKIFTYSRADAYINHCDEKTHPTQKPVALYKWLLKNYAKTGDKILDTHFGSLSIGIACHDMGFDLWAYELDADYFKAAKERLERHQQQGRLFE